MGGRGSAEAVKQSKEWGRVAAGGGGRGGVGGRMGRKTRRKRRELLERAQSGHPIAAAGQGQVLLLLLGVPAWNPPSCPHGAAVLGQTARLIAPPDMSLPVWGDWSHSERPACPSMCLPAPCPDLGPQWAPARGLWVSWVEWRFL